MNVLSIFLRQVRARSDENQRAMAVLSQSQILGQMISVLRQELDSMVRVMYLLSQPTERRRELIEASVEGRKWLQPNSRACVTDKEMVEHSETLHGWARSVYKFGCAFIHLSDLHDYNHRDPFEAISADDRASIIEHCRYYHGGPSAENVSMADFAPYLPRILEKISSNLGCYLRELESGTLSAEI